MLHCKNIQLLRRFCRKECMMRVRSGCKRGRVTPYFHLLLSIDGGRFGSPLDVL